MISLILAGKVGSSIASEIGSMRVSEQIDALEVMGINSLNYLVFPKIIAMLLYPFLITISMFLGIIGGLLAMTLTGVPSEAYIQGIQMDFESYHVTYSYIKTLVFFETPFTFLIISLYKKQFVLIIFCFISIVKSNNNKTNKTGLILTKKAVGFFRYVFSMFCCFKK